MEANHPIFLPRLVPHVFNRQSSTRLTMSDSRPPSPNESNTSTPSSRSAMRTTPNNQPQTINVQQKITTLSALVDGLNIETASSLFIEFYRLHPQHAVSTLSILSSGDHKNRVVFGSLIKGIFAADCVIAGKVFLDLLGLELGEAWLLCPVRHYHIDLMFIIFSLVWRCGYVYACFLFFFVTGSQAAYIIISSMVLFCY